MSGANRPNGRTDASAVGPSPFNETLEIIMKTFRIRTTVAAIAAAIPLSIAFNALSRRPLVSIEMNHCAVLRKMSGALERQECG